MIYKLIKITNEKLKKQLSKNKKILKINLKKVLRKNKNEINLKIAMDESTLYYNR